METNLPPNSGGEYTPQPPPPISPTPPQPIIASVPAAPRKKSSSGLGILCGILGVLLLASGGLNVILGASSILETVHSTGAQSGRKFQEVVVSDDQDSKD